MTRTLLARIERLERKRTFVLPKEICVIGTRFPDKIVEIDGVFHIEPHFNAETYALFAMTQQGALLAMLNELNEEGEQNVRDTSPASMDFNDQLAPGAKPLKFRYYTDASGQEWQVSLEDGQTWRV